MKHNHKFDEMAMMYYFGELTGADSQNFEAHLNDCPHCQAELAKLKDMGEMMASVPDPVPTDELVKRANRKVMNVIAEESKAGVYATVKEFFNELADSVQRFMARPQYQLVSVSATFLIGILIGKIWLSSGLQNDPDMLISFLNHQPEMTQEQQDKVRSAFANYMIQSGDIEMSELLQGNGESEDGMVQVNFKVQQNFTLEGGLDNPAIVNMLRYSARHEQDKARRLRAINLLNNAVYNKDIEETIISVLLHDEDIDLRLRALEMLSDNTINEEIKNAFKTVVLNDTSAAIRKAGLEQLKTIGSEDVVPIMALTSSRDKDPEVKAMAAEFLEELENNN